MEPGMTLIARRRRETGKARSQVAPVARRATGQRERPEPKGLPFDSRRPTAALDVCELLLLMRYLSHRLAPEYLRLASGALACSLLLLGCSTTGPTSSSA